VPSIDYNKIFQKLKEKYDFVTNPNLATKTIYCMKKQESLLDLSNCREFSTPPTFYSLVDANKYVDEWVKIKKEFQFNHGNDPCPNHCNLIFEKLEIEYQDKYECLTQKDAQNLF
jgi:hypothetical protein